jgi:hypothetical protein
VTGRKSTPEYDPSLASVSVPQVEVQGQVDIKAGEWAHLLSQKPRRWVVVRECPGQQPPPPVHGLLSSTVRWLVETSPGLHVSRSRSGRNYTGAQFPPLRA